MRTGRLSDTPWFWVYVFATSALAAILVIGPKYLQRQAQLEREYRARVVMRQTTEIPGTRAATERPGDPFISLGPLINLLGVIAGLFGLYAAREVWRRRFYQHECDPLP
jgi:hypothetical protein